MNAEKQVIKKAIEINAPKEKVWNVLLQDHYNRQWYAYFSEGTYAETDWQLGSKVIFKDNSGDGLVGKVVTHRPYEILAVEYEGILTKGHEMYHTPEAQAMQGFRETYHLTENNTTLLNIESDMGEEYFDMMSAAWDKALQKIKELTEKTA